MIVPIIILCIVYITSPIGLTHLLVRYGWNWKFKDLRTFDKCIFIYLWLCILAWVGTLTYMIIISK